MTAKSIWIALSDDWELRGNGLGDVQKHQYDTAIQLMDCYDALGVSATFNVEVMQQMAFERFRDRFPDIARQADFWRQAVTAMAKRGYDVQLHTHPQWHDAEYDGRRWRLDRRWDITAYTPEEIDRFLAEGLAFLEEFVPRTDLIAFRSGSWGIGPPSRPLMEALIRHGIRLDVSIVAGLVYCGESIALDYRRLECPYEPYYPDLDDARKVSAESHGLVEIPTQSVPLEAVLGSPLSPARMRETVKPLVRGLRCMKTGLQRMLTGRNRDPYEVPLSPFGVWSRCDFVMDFGVRRPVDHWIRAVDRVIDRAMTTPGQSFLVFENHTKDLMAPSDFDRIATIVRHIQERYADIIRFVHLKDLANNLDLLNPRLSGAS